MKMRTGEKIFYVFNILIMLVIGAIMLYPYLNQVALAFNEGMDSMRGGITIFPRKFTLANFETVIFSDDFITAVIVTVIKVVLNTVLNLIITFACAYGLSRRGLRFKKGITMYLLIPGYISAGVIPVYILYRTLGLIDSFWVYILPGMFSFYNMVIIRSFLQELPQSVEESAMIDGANEIHIMFKIIIPMSLPVMATVALWIAVGAWNDWTTTLMYITDSDLFTLQYLLMQMIKQSERASQMAIEMSMNKSAASVKLPTSQAVQSAALVVTTLPIVLLYPFLQKYFIKGVTFGAVKE